MRTGALFHCVRCALALAALGVGTSASADTPPGAWDVARDPREASRWELHVRVQRMLQRGIEGPLGDAGIRLEAARVWLEDANAATSPDVRLRFDLGVVYEDLEQHGRAIEVLAPALAMAPEHPAATRALEALSYAYAKLGMAREELDAWRLYIPRIVDDRARATEMMNMGEAEMRLGYLDDAIDTFREVLALCGELPNSVAITSTYALTLWDLAVALDRSGDPRGAIDAAHRAMALSWQRGPLRGSMTGLQAIEDTTTVFFVPEWEREWYLALGAAAAARAAGDPRESARLWHESRAHRQTYVDRATSASSAPSADPWLSVARRRLGEAALEETSARKRAAKLPPPAGPAATHGSSWGGD